GTMVEHTSEPKCQFSIDLTVWIFHRTLGQFHFFKHCSSMRQKGVPCRSEFNRTGAANKKFRSQRAFEFADHLTQWRLRHAQSYRCATDVQFFGYRDKCFQPPDFHIALSLYCDIA